MRTRHAGLLALLLGAAAPGVRGPMTSPDPLERAALAAVMAEHLQPRGLPGK